MWEIDNLEEWWETFPAYVTERGAIAAALILSAENDRVAYGISTNEGERTAIVFAGIVWRPDNHPAPTAPA